MARGWVWVLLVAWLAACGDGATDAPAPGPAPGAENAEAIEELRGELEALRKRNLELAAEVEWLRQQMRALGELGAVPPEPGAGGAEEEPDRAPEAGPDDFDEELLAERGVPPSEVERLREYFDGAQLEALALRHRAVRQGYLGKPRYLRELAALQQSQRRDLGDEDYDLLLYATGRKNRVVVHDVLAQSPGERAGFQAGDVILSYDDRRIFRPGELRRATTQGKVGTAVPVMVLRNGERIRLFTERGPIGVKLTRARMQPESTW